MTLALLLVTALWRVRTEQVDSLTEREIAATHLLALASDAYFGRQLARVEGIAAGLEGADPADPGLRPVLTQAIDRYDDWFSAGIMDDQGWPLVEEPPIGPPVNIADRSHFIEVMSGNSPIIGETVLPRRRGGGPAIPIAAGFTLSDNHRAMLAFFSRPAAWAESLRQDQSGRHVLVVDRAGQIMADTEAAEATPTLNRLGPTEAANRALSGDSGWGIVRAQGKGDLFEAYAPIPAIGGALIVQQPTMLLYALPDRLMTLGASIATLAIALAAALSWSVNRRLALARANEADARSLAERSALALSRANWVAEQRRTFLEGLIESIPIPVLVTRGPQHTVTLANGAAKALTPRHSPIGSPLTDLFASTTAQSLGQQADEVYTTGQRAEGTDEGWRLRADDGRDRHFTYAISRYLGPEGAPQGVLLVAHETTDSVLARASLNAEKDAFMSMASHELRTPLTSVNLSLQVIERHLRSPKPDYEDVAGLLSLARDQMSRAIRLMGDLLDVARDQSGRLVPDLTPVALGPLLTRSVKQQYTLLDESGPKLSVVTSESPVVLGDEARVEQVITNLLSNAVKYSPPGGLIDVRLSCDDGWGVLEVEDHGIGVPADERHYLFAPFSRTPLSRQRGIEGTGLGLYVSRRIIEGCNGRLEYRATPGGGSTFTMRLPLCE